jgi:hypothetical protein
MTNRDNTRDAAFILLAIAALIFILTSLLTPAHAQDFDHIKRNGVEVIVPKYPMDSVQLTQAVTNGVVLADLQVGATLDAKLNACIVAAKLQLPHICDARNVGSGTISAEVDVGDSSFTPVALLLPQSGTWTVTITNGTSCGFKLFDASAIISDGTTGEGMTMVIANGASANDLAVVCTDPAPAGGGSYVLARGFSIKNNLGGIAVDAALEITKTFDSSVFEKITTVNTNGTGLYVHNTCCGLVLRDMVSDSVLGAGGIPCKIGNTGENTSDVVFTGHLSCVHPGTGNNALLVRGDSTWTQDISFQDVYIEPNQADLTTALIQVSAGGPINFGSARAGNFSGSPTNFLFDVNATNGNGTGFYLGSALVPTGGNVINDHFHVVTVTGTVNQTVGPYGWGQVGAQFWLTGLQVNGISRFGSTGTSINTILAGSATLTFTAIAAQTCQEQPVAVTGASAGKVSWASPTANPNSNISWSTWTSTNQVNVRACNPTAGSITPTAVIWSAYVIQ